VWGYTAMRPREGSDLIWKCVLVGYLGSDLRLLGGNLDLPRQISSSPGRQRWFRALPEEGRPSKRLKTHFTWFLGSKNIFGEKKLKIFFEFFFSKFQHFSQNFNIFLKILKNFFFEIKFSR